MRFTKMSAALAALALVMVGCSSDGGDDTTVASETTAVAAETTVAEAGAETTVAEAGTETTVAEAGADTTAAAAAAPEGALVISTDLPLQGASADASRDTQRAVEMILEAAGGKAGAYDVVVKHYDDSTAAKGGWDDATCAKNAADHVANANEVAVMGTYNSGCAKIILPVLNQDASGPMLMVSHANTNPGLTKAWEPGEPDKYYPTGVRNYARIIATDDFQGAADAQMAAKDLGVKKCVVLDDAQTYGKGVAKAFVDEAKKQGIEDRCRRLHGTPSSRTTPRCSKASRPRAPTASSSAASTTTTGSN